MPGTSLTQPTVRTVTTLADGRQLIYYDSGAACDAACDGGTACGGGTTCDGGTAARRDAVDERPLDPQAPGSEVRLDPATGDWVTIAAHRQARTYQPPPEECPLCPSRDGRHSEIPAADYQVAVFENRFPSLAGPPAEPVRAAEGLWTSGPGAGRCEVVCFTADHEASFADLTPERARLVLDAWTDRTAELSALPGVRQVYCFENRGAEIGVTLAHPHGQIYALPFTAPRTARMAARAAEHRATAGRNLFDDLLAAERAHGERVVLAGTHWTAFVPFAARWPYEVHLYPHRRVPDLTALDADQRDEFPTLYLELLRRFDRLFGTGRTPYISAWHQAPADQRDELALHLELFTIRRTADKLKYLAGVESGMDAFVNDVTPEHAARRLREATA
ncbi:MULTISPECIES: galactose-1-phosphate uridylyltransferase [Streptomycetaceae]|uniref:galactose-1-phosphate uridylyltransferase n=1 Tax=Streptomycetaceae TaxID=2062 RepID=UPI0006711672|nr:MULTISPECIES: galactose-1-phosphate uridylyltransferase [Streptomycetaceae]OKI07795.1 galactose-1-phosphate uridylyltransferase [Streptomyces sp. CB02056]